MKVILAGYSKTGTKTLNSALTILGYNVYDYLENSYYLNEDWVRIFENGVKPGDFERMYKGVDAVIDSPCYYYCKELSEAFPDAKIILMMRDEDSWYKSLLKQADELSTSWMRWLFMTFTVYGIKRIRYRYHILKFMGDVYSWPRSKLVAHNENTLKRMYREHNLYIQTTVPKDKLLVYRVTDGWRPLCEFLGMEVPDEPFPHKNKSGKLLAELRKTNKALASIEREFKITLLVFSAIFAFFVYQVYQWIFV